MRHEIIDVYEAEVTRWSKLVTIEAWRSCECEHCHDWHIDNPLDYDVLIEYDSDRMNAPVLTLFKAYLGGNEHGEEYNLWKWHFTAICHEKHNGWGNTNEILRAFNEALDQMLSDVPPSLQPIADLYKEKM